MFECLHVNHLNLVADGFDACVTDLSDTFGARFNLDIPQPGKHAALLSIGTVILELIAPDDFLVVARYGPHWVGIEYQIDDLDAARRAVEEHDIRIVRDIGSAFHTDPRDTYGVAFELFEGNFHTGEGITLGNGGPDWAEPLRPLEYWRDEHELGCTGLARWSVVVDDVGDATTWFTSFLGARPAYETTRVDGARAVGLELGDGVVELLAPTGPGVVQQHLARFGPGIRSTVLRVADRARAEEYFRTRGIGLVPGDAESSFALDEARTGGVRFELTE